MFSDRTETDFFDYPQHFAFIGASEGVVHTHRTEKLPMDRIGTGWGNLDVWPDSKWIPTPSKRRSGILEKGFRFSDQSTVLAARFQAGLRKNSSSPPMRVRCSALGLKLFTTTIRRIPNVEIRGSQQVADLVQRSTTPNSLSAGSEVEHPAQSDFPSVGTLSKGECR